MGENYRALFLHRLTCLRVSTKKYGIFLLNRLTFVRSLTLSQNATLGLCTLEGFVSGCVHHGDFSHVTKWSSLIAELGMFCRQSPRSSVGLRGLAHSGYWVWSLALTSELVLTLTWSSPPVHHLCML